MSAITMDPQDIAVVDDSPPASYWVREFNFGEEDIEVNTLFLVHPIGSDSIDPDMVAMNFHTPSGTLVLDAQGIMYNDDIWDSFIANMLPNESDD